MIQYAQIDNLRLTWKRWFGFARRKIDKAQLSVPEVGVLHPRLLPLKLIGAAFAVCLLHPFLFSYWCCELVVISNIGSISSFS